MPSLHELQNTFLADLIDGTDNTAGMLAQGVFPTARLLQIYRNNLFISLTNALLAVHPVMQRLVGDDFFDYCAREYIRAHPSRAGNLHEFGAHFGDFLDAFPPAGGLPYLPDVARLEWARHQAFHAAEGAPFDTRKLAGLAPEAYADLCFTLHPSARVLKSPYPVSRIWEANLPDSGPDEILDLRLGGETVLVARPASQVLVQRLEAAEGAWLARLAAGATLAGAAQAAWKIDPDFALERKLAEHVQRCTLVDLKLPAQPPKATGD